MMREFFLLILLLSPSLAGEVSAVSPIRAGISVVEITPPVGTPLGGFGKNRHAGNIHDSLFARILVLKTPETSVALVSSDLHKLQSPSLVNRIRDELGIAHTVLLSSQTRSAPSLDPETRLSAWGKEIESKIFRQVKQAQEQLFSAKILFGQGALMGAHNIRVFQDDGTVQDRWENPKEEGTAPIDPAVQGHQDRPGRSRPKSNSGSLFLRAGGSWSTQSRNLGRFSRVDESSCGRRIRPERRPASF